ncbi:MAG: thioredoxin family protein [Litorilinea sp.]
MLLERILILLVIAAIGTAFYAVWRLWQSRRLQQLAATDAPLALRQLLGATQGPAILYFTAADCSQCRYRQTPILTSLLEHLPIALHTIDAPSQPELVRHYGILTVPSTVVLTPELRPVAINHGLATRPQLQEQLGNW